MEHIPWIEKYRPTQFNDIVLEPLNRKIFLNIIEGDFFPNLLFYGPPGTGKTTTIINLIKFYQNKKNQKGKEFVIHLNASDDRGIDIIRNQINSFVKTNSLFSKGNKFVILDEVDYMTKNAQQALHYLIQKYSKNIRFCLICNYISRIDNTLRNEFIRIRFCNLPKKEIYDFLKKIIKNEQLSITDEEIKSIQYMFKSDIRSMINFIQSNIENFEIFNKIIDVNFWENMIIRLKNENTQTNINYILNKCDNLNLNICNFTREFIKYLIFNKPYALTKKWLSIFEPIIHNVNLNDTYILHLLILRLDELYKKL